MARPPRLQIAGAWHHIIARGIERSSVFKQDRDREHFLELLEVMAARFACNLSAYVLMENHFHLFLQTLEPNLSRAVQWLTISYGAWFNRRHERAGHLFQGRFKAVVVDPSDWAVRLTRYIHLNPVRIKRLGLDKSARQAARRGLSQPPEPEAVRQRIRTLREFRWSSYRAYAGYAKAPEWLKADWILRHGGRRSSQQRARYRDYCESAIREQADDPIEESIYFSKSAWAAARFSNTCWRTRTAGNCARL
jgi:putative transposase